MDGNRPDGHAEGQVRNSGRLPGWAVLVIASGCAAFWLVRAGVIGSTAAGILAAAAAIVIVTSAVIAAGRRRRRRRDLNARLASDLRAVAARDTETHDERETAARD